MGTKQISNFRQYFIPEVIGHPRPYIIISHDYALNPQLAMRPVNFYQRPEGFVEMPAVPVNTIESSDRYKREAI